MFHTVLVPLDGSRFAESALPIAARLAKGASATLHLVLVHQPAAAFVGMGDVTVPSLELESELRARGQSYLAAMAANLSASRGGPVEFRQFDGTGGPDICEEAGRIGADFVVMATHGRSTFRRFWLGSVADYVVRHLAVPILLVHPDHSAEPRIASSLCDILVALDLSTDAEAILEPVAALARMTGAALTLVHVAEASPTAAKVRLNQIAARLRVTGLTVSTRVIGGAGAVSGLLDLLEEDEFDLVAMTTHGRGGMRRLLMGSVADKVIRGTTKPVLVLRPSPTVS